MTAVTSRSSWQLLRLRATPASAHRGTGDGRGGRGEEDGCGDRRTIKASVGTATATATSDDVLTTGHRASQRAVNITFTPSPFHPLSIVGMKWNRMELRLPFTTRHITADVYGKTRQSTAVSNCSSRPTHIGIHCNYRLQRGAVSFLADRTAAQ